MEPGNLKGKAVGDICSSDPQLLVSNGGSRARVHFGLVQIAYAFLKP